MVQTSDDTITSGLESLVITEPKPYTMNTIAPDISLTSLDEIRSAIDAEYIKATEALSSCEPNKKPAITNRFMSVLAFYGSSIRPPA